MPETRPRGPLLRLLGASADSAVRWRLAAAAALAALGGLLAALGPLALKDLVDAVPGIRDDPHHTAARQAVAAGAGYLVALCGARLLSEFRPLLTGAAEQRLLARLTQRTFAHLLALPLRFHLTRRNGELIHAIQLSSTGCQLLAGHLVNSILPVLVELVTVTVVLLQLDHAALVATFTTTAAAYFLLFGIGSRRVSRSARAVTSASMEVSATLSDALLSVEAVKCFVAEADCRARLATSANALQARWRDLHRTRAGLGVAVAIVFGLSVAASLGIAATAVVDGSMTVGGFVLASVYMLQVMRPLEVLGAATRDVYQAVGFIRPVIDILGEATEPERPPNMREDERRPASPTAASPPTRSSRPMPNSGCSPGVRFQQLTFGYDTERRVLNGLDLDVPPGRSLAIVGASGSGKSSLVRLLLRLYEPQSGRILLDQRPLQSMSIAELRSLVGLVPQDTVLFNDSIANNIRLGEPRATREDVEAAARRAQLHDFITGLPDGYDTPVGERGLMLSGGERQRVAIARAVLKSPRIFVFDEATSMLDSHTEASILRDLRAVSDGCTTITIAHRLSTIQHADEIALLAGGQIAERGTHAALVQRDGAYAALWRRQAMGQPG